jgi:hypothetical protein
MFLLFTFGREKFYEGGPRVRRSPIRWSVFAPTARKVVNDCRKIEKHLSIDKEQLRLTAATEQVHFLST